MPTPVNSLTPGQFTQHRVVTGAPVAADSSPSGSFPARTGLLNCRGYETVVVYAILTGGAGPTVTIQPLVYDREKDRFALHVTSAAIADGEAIEIAVHEGEVFLRLNAVAGNPTQVELRVMPGKRAAPLS